MNLTEQATKLKKFQNPWASNNAHLYDRIGYTDSEENHSQGFLMCWLIILMPAGIFCWALLFKTILWVAQ